MSLQIPGETVGGFTAPAYNFNSGTGVLTFSVYINNTTGNGCILSTPPVALNITNSQSVPASITPVGWNSSYTRYQYDVSITFPDTGDAISVIIAAISLCNNAPLPGKTLTIVQTPNCCRQPDVEPNPPTLNSTAVTRLYQDVNASVLASAPLISAWTPSLHNRRIPIQESPTFLYQSDSAAPGGFIYNDSMVLHPVPGTEDEFTLEVNFSGLNNCGGNRYRIEFYEMYGINHCCSPINRPIETKASPSQETYCKPGVTASEFQPLLANVDTFWHDFKSVVQPYPSNAIRTFTNNPTNTTLPVPNYLISNVPQPSSHHYIVSMTITGGGTVNPANATFSIPNGNGNCTLSMRMKFHIQQGQGIAPNTRYGTNPLLRFGWDRWFEIRIIPLQSSPCDWTVRRGYFRLPACNQRLRGTITGSFGGVTVNAVPVNNGGGLNSLTPTAYRNYGSSAHYSGIVREWEQFGAGKASLFRINRFYENNTAKSVWGNTMYDFNPGVSSGYETQIFKHKEAFQVLHKLPFRVSDYTDANPDDGRNRVSALLPPIHSHLISYEIAKIVEENFNVIFPLSNTGFWQSVGDGQNPLSGAFTAPANSFITAIELAPIISYLAARVPLDFSPCCNVDAANFKLTLVFYSEVSRLLNYLKPTPTQNIIRNGLGPGYFGGSGGGTSSFDDWIVSPSNFVVELTINLNTQAITNIAYRDRVLIATLNGNATTGFSMFSAGYIPGSNETPTTNAWRLDAYTMQVTQLSATSIQMTNSSPINIVTQNDRIGIYPLKTPSIIPQPQHGDRRRKFICNNLVITTLNLCPKYSTGTRTDINDCNCDYTGTIYNALGNSPAHVLNPRIKGEAVTRPSTMLLNDLANGAASFGDILAETFLTVGKPYTPIIEKKALITSSYCCILTPAIKLNVLSHRVNNSFVGQADFIL